MRLAGGTREGETFGRVAAEKSGSGCSCRAGRRRRCSGVCVQQAGARCTDTQGHRRGFPGHRGDTEAGTGTLPLTLLIEDITDNQESGH